MKINYNTTAMVGVNALNQNDALAAKSTQRLSSGLKISRAKDNPSGYALSRKMKAQLESLDQASNNTSDGISIIKTADGALSEVHDMLQRMNELAVKASTGSLTEGDREIVNQEIVQLKEEIQRVSETTKFNGQNLLDGTFDLKGYTDEVNVKVASYSDSVAKGKYQIALSGLTFDADGNITSNLEDITLTDVGGNLAAGTNVESISGNRVTLSGTNGFEISLDIMSAYGNGTTFTIDVTGIGAMTLQVGSNEGQVLDVRIPSVGLKSLGIQDLDVKTADSAKEAISLIDEAIKVVSEIRSRLGSYQNRLESTEESIDITVENMTSAYSTITDVDMAEEYTQYSTYQILTQASTSVLAQANERPSQVLQLLQ